ncbi:hypothetical protein AMTRI_Chr04g245330 [Amborella trichopoda]
MKDIKELTSLIDDKYAIMCVKHEYTQKESTKMDGIVQTVYPRKNWSSIVLYNCMVDGDPESYPKSLHFTSGGLWFDAWKDCDFADLWIKEMEEYKSCGGGFECNGDRLECNGFTV